MRRAARTLALAGGLYASMLGAVVLFEESLIYFPTRGGRVTAHGREVWLRAPDGPKLHAFLAEPRAGVTRRAALLYLHGNAGNLAGRSDVLEVFTGQGARVLGLDYRGYGHSEGKPSEAGLYADALAAYDWLAAARPGEPIVVLGESLGGGPACEVGLRRELAGLVLCSTFTSIADMGALSFPFLPVRLIVRTRFDNLAKVAQISAPKLIVHSRRDETVPFEMGERLARAAKPPVEHLWLERSFHNDTYFTEGERFGATLSAFLDRVEGNGVRPAQ